MALSFGRRRWKDILWPVVVGTWVFLCGYPVLAHFQLASGEPRSSLTASRMANSYVGLIRTIRVELPPDRDSIQMPLMPSLSLEQTLKKSSRCLLPFMLPSDNNIIISDGIT